MIILRAKYTNAEESIVKVNDNVFCPCVDGNKTWEEVKNYIKNGGQVEPFISDAQKLEEDAKKAEKEYIASAIDSGVMTNEQLIRYIDLIKSFEDVKIVLKQLVK